MGTWQEPTKANQFWQQWTQRQGPGKEDRQSPDRWKDRYRNWRGSTPEPDPFSPLWSPTPGPAHHLSPGYWLLPPPLSSAISLAARGTLPNPQFPSVAPLQSLQHGACRLATPQAVPEVASLPPPLLLAPQCFLTTLTGFPRLAGNSRYTSLTRIEETL